MLIDEKNEGYFSIVRSWKKYWFWYEWILN